MYCKHTTQVLYLLGGYSITARSPFWKVFTFSPSLRSDKILKMADGKVERKETAMAANITAQVKRSYGIERTLGDILLNKENNSVFATLDFGFFGQVTVGLIKDKEHGGYTISKSYKTRDGQMASFNLGKTFPAKDKSGNIVEGITQGLFGLLREYDSATQKTLTKNNDGLQLTTHRLKEPKQLGDTNFHKVGWITGRFAIEKMADNAEAPVETPTLDITDEDIPF